VYSAPVDKPELVNASRMWTGAIEKPNLSRCLGHRDIVYAEARRLHALASCLVGDDEDVAHYVKRIGAHLGVREHSLGYKPHGARISDIKAAEIDGRAFMRNPKDASAIVGTLDRQSFADHTVSS
jgi:hypothetical protein